VTDSIEVSILSGGYIMINYLMKYQNHVIHPFARYAFYNGGKKHERDARAYDLKEIEFGIEWMPFPNFELVVAYNIADRRYEDFLLQENRQVGRFMRLQAQLNF
jgi:hypothetical protein